MNCYSSLQYTWILFFIMVCVTACQSPESASSQPPTFDVRSTGLEAIAQVDVMVGTSRMGHVYPGATVPFGMVQLSPDTDSIPFLHEGKYTGRVYEYCAGYQYEDATIVGFSHTHFSGTGHSDLGDIRIMPTTTTERQLRPGTEEHPESGYRSRFSHEEEEAEPGYYRVLLDDYGVEAELTASQRVGVHRYHYPEKADARRLVVDLDAGIYDYPGKEVWTFVRVENDTLITGYKMMTGWARTRTLYFAISTSEPIKNFGHVRWDEEPYGGFWRRFDQAEDFPEMAGRQVTLWLEFDQDDANCKELEVQVALSPTGMEGALKNLEAETAGRTFDEVRAAARDQWAEQLGKMRVVGMDQEQTGVLRTAQYHTALGPTLFSDVDGRYRGLDQRNHNGRDKWGAFKNYGTFSLWDTYRAQHPWLQLTEAMRNREMARSMLAHQGQSVHGMLPIWSHHANDNWCMIGYHAVSVLADAAVKGGMDAEHWPGLLEAALEASVATASHPTFDGLDAYRDLGYVPADGARGQGASVSKTLEMAYDDWCVNVLAQCTGDTATQQAYFARSQHARNVWDPSVRFMRPRLENGTFREDFDVLNTHGQGFIEGNAWNYSLHVAQDVPWLIEAHGGPAAFVAHLDSLFTMELPDEAMAHTEDVTRDGLLGNYVHGNEPSHHAPWMFALAGRPDLTQYWTRRICNEMYGPGIDGLCGNDDAGQMSAWYLFGALGFYPICPGDERYILGSPSVKEADLVLVPTEGRGIGKIVRIRTTNQAPENVYVQSVSWNGEAIDLTTTPWITHSRLAAGGTLHFEMGPDQPHISAGTTQASYSSAVR
jgi:predicted alpha-1,2-mannosidase